VPLHGADRRCELPAHTEVLLFQRRHVRQMD
jgi:hypothetical protein